MDILPGEATPLSQAGFDNVLNSLGVNAPSLWSLMTVETRGFGFLPDRRPKILFERHVFHKRTGGQFSARHPDISAREAGGYVGGSAEYRRLALAMTLNAGEALESTSWGLAQIMGFNARRLGYASAQAMVDQFRDGEDQQLDGALRFIRANAALATAFADEQWEKVAFFYNGPDYAKNNYHKKLASYFTLYSIRGVPQIRIRVAQAWLTFLGYSPRGEDGILGDGTMAAIVAFQKDHSLTVNAELDEATFLALKQAAG